jgi:hypothetical protein
MHQQHEGQSKSFQGHLQVAMAEWELRDGSLANRLVALVVFGCAGAGSGTHFVAAASDCIAVVAVADGDGVAALHWNECRPHVHGTMDAAIDPLICCFGTVARAELRMIGVRHLDNWKWPTRLS